MPIAHCIVGQAVPQILHDQSLFVFMFTHTLYILNKVHLLKKKYQLKDIIFSNTPRCLPFSIVSKFKEHYLKNIPSLLQLL